MAWISNKELDLARCGLTQAGSGDLLSSFSAAKVRPGGDNSQDAPLLVRIAKAEKIVYSEPRQLADALRIAFYALGREIKEPFLDEYERNAAKKALHKLVALTKEFPRGEEAYRIVQPLLEPWLRPPALSSSRDHSAAYAAMLTEAGYFSAPAIEPHGEDEALTPEQEAVRREVEWDLAAQFPQGRPELAALAEGMSRSGGGRPAVVSSVRERVGR